MPLAQTLSLFNQREVKKMTNFFMKTSSELDSCLSLAGNCFSEITFDVSMRLHSSINEKDFPKYGTLAISLNWKTISKKNMNELEKHATNWIETPLSKFGFKCVMNEHDLCVDSSCECLCHHA